MRYLLYVGSVLMKGLAGPASVNTTTAPRLQMTALSGIKKQILRSTNAYSLC
jgi:hypothetical protein